jgi:hypothetical protein
MRNPTRVPLLAALAAGICFAAAHGRGADDNNAMKQEIAKVADGKGNAKAIAGKEELEAVMHMFAPRNKGGYGVGDVPGAVTPDHIEQKLIQLTKKPLAKDAAAKQGPALARAGEISAAVAEVAELYADKEGKKNPATWKKYSQDMHKAGKDFAAAGKKGDPAAIFTAAKTLNKSCNDCHADFRD